ncbi:GNAT family N-acetyltransferase [Companilactobacillus sp. FL22-1]|uniref:GNAT family N-acetyltransferase n=1 Tax=Companilactobacillus sp. FL22-1 TaxID=3373892 RepID=UPI003754A4CC
MNLIGKNIQIRGFKNEDFEAFFALVSDKRNHELAGLEYTDDRTFAQNLLELYQRRQGAFVIALKKTDQLVGIIELNKRGESNALLLTREIGFVVSRDFRRQGYAKEAVQLLIDYGFNEIHLNEIWAATETKNLAPQELLESLNFKYIYEAEQTLPYTGQHNLVKYYVLKK